MLHYNENESNKLKNSKTKNYFIIIKSNIINLFKKKMKNKSFKIISIMKYYLIEIK